MSHGGGIEHSSTRDNINRPFRSHERRLTPTRVSLWAYTDRRSWSAVTSPPGITLTDAHGASGLCLPGITHEPSLSHSGGVVVNSEDSTLSLPG